ncbi:zinc metallopeptidase [Alkalimarinus coralli]|uniref:zinc metallopeptidase n=1 Tax=Alkalimarinus coralli TaxID=2935863 RepID=UPI00202AE115|nr:zinc metallopeptidase [Alkalimarinus coralli]
MIIIFALILLCTLIYGPQIWVRYVMKKHSAELSNIPGTGGELAQHLIKQFQLKGVDAEQTAPNSDHYDDNDKKVRLSPSIYNGKSLTAIAVAAHEVGHAIQFYRQEQITHLRKKFTPLAKTIEKISIGILFSIPLVTVIFKVPHVALLTALVGASGMLAAVLVQLIVLPLEWDASFNKALPILVEGNYIHREQETAVKSVLRAAALTYVAAALADMLRLWRWLAILRGAIR